MPKLKASAVAPSNIAFSKYWGKQNDELTLPLNDSISMSLDQVKTHTTVEFADQYDQDQVLIGDETHPLQLVSGKKKSRVTDQLGFLREKAGIELKAKVVSQNNFPMGAGIASSASAFSALTAACLEALEIEVDKKEQSILTRLAGSGSATRSVFGGFVRWYHSDQSENCFAKQLYKPGYWSLADLILVVSSKHKKYSFLSGHQLAQTSPFLQAKVKQTKKANDQLEGAFKSKDFSLLGEVIEQEMFSLHSVAMTSDPSILYWSAETIDILKEVRQLRREGLEVYATLDAGPNVHLIMEQKNLDTIEKRFKQGFGVKRMYRCQVGKGVKTTSNHLF